MVTTIKQFQILNLETEAEVLSVNSRLLIKGNFLVIALEFKIFCSSESDSGSIEIFLYSIAVILKSINFSFVEVKVIFGGRLTVDSLRNLLSIRFLLGMHLQHLSMAILVVLWIPIK